jgi:transposase
MYLRRCKRSRGDKQHAYWALVESQRTAQGPRQRVVAYLGDIDEDERLGVKEVAEEKQVRQGSLFGDPVPVSVGIDPHRIFVERTRQFGGGWLGLELLDKLGLRELVQKIIPSGREEVPWPMMVFVLILARLLDPSSELAIAEHFYSRSALADLLGIPEGKINDDRLYRALDALLPHKEAVETHLKSKMGELFGIEYDLLLYDVTSTYFEGSCKNNNQAKLGYSRDHRPDCKQVCIALVVSRSGLPLGYEVFDGNRTDVTTVQDIVEIVESRYGKADRIWVMDRGMVSEENLEFLKEGGRRYILGTPKAALKKFEQELLSQDWETIHEGLDVRLCPSPDGTETYILCRSEQRREKEKAIHQRFEQRIEAGLIRLQQNCLKNKRQSGAIERQVGKLMGANSRAQSLFKVAVNKREDGGASVEWEKIKSWQDWAELSEGCYLLRSNVTDWSAKDLWEAYIQLTQAEAAFRVQKSDLRIRPIWHQKRERVHAHILVCFLAYVLWKTLGQLCSQAGLGDEPRKVLDEIKTIMMVDIVIPTNRGTIIRKRCIGKPEKHQAILLQKLKLTLPETLRIYEM